MRTAGQPNSTTSVYRKCDYAGTHVRLEKIVGAFSEKGICDLGQETKCKIVQCVSETIQSVISLMAKTSATKLY